MPQDNKAGRTHSNISSKPTPKGVNWLLVIAIDEYDDCAKLYNCVRDAKAITKTLTEKYQFQLFDALYNADANRKNIVAKLNELQKKIQPDVDNLLLYFSGHGETEGDESDDDEQIGYLVPVDAARGEETDYLPHSFFKEKLNRIKTRHTFVIMDACFSGSFFIKIKSDKPSGVENNPSRWGFSSSLSHEVALDGKPGDNSPFAQCLLEALHEHSHSFGIHGLAAAVEQKMRTRQARQTPVCLPFSDPNRYKGQFFFHPKQNEAQVWIATEAADTAAAYYDFWQKYRDHTNAEEALWRYACKQNDVPAYQLYRQQYPRGKYAYDVFDKIDDATFAQCVTVRDFQNYLRTFGEDANHADEAHAKIDALLSGIIVKTPTPKIIVPEEPKTESSPLGGRGLEPEMVFVQGGTFKMGSNDYEDEKPIHEVTLRDFYIGKYPVTQAQWRAVMGSDPPELYFKGCDQCPVEGVSWNDVQEFIKTLNQQTNKTYRLPTEAEWEYAARGGKQSRGFTYTGSDNLEEVGWFWENSGDKRLSGNWDFDKITKNNCKTHQVGEKKPNELGIYDMSGNVWEWCEDVWHDNYEGAPKDGSAWISGGDQPRRVVRGGAWYGYDLNCRVSDRNDFYTDLRLGNLGFRLAGY